MIYIIDIFMRLWSLQMTSPRRWNDVSGTDAEPRRRRRTSVTADRINKGRRKHYPRWDAASREEERSGDVGNLFDADLLLGQPDHITVDVVEPRRTWLKNFLRMWGKRTAHRLYTKLRSSLADDNDDRKRVWSTGDTVRVWGWSVNISNEFGGYRCFNACWMFNHPLWLLVTVTQGTGINVLTREKAHKVNLSRNIIRTFDENQFGE